MGILWLPISYQYENSRLCKNRHFVITLATKNGEIKFNLSTGFPREIALCQTIIKLQSEKSGATINVTTSDKEKISIKILDITDLKFSEAEYVKAKIHAVKTGSGT
jgi:hypothetical protein